jgi:hypothetical protein
VIKLNNQIDMQFMTKVDTDQLDELVKKLQEIESKGIIDLSKVSADVKEVKKEIDEIDKKSKQINKSKSKKSEDTSAEKEKEKISQNQLDIERAKQQVIAAQNKGLSETERLAKSFLDILKDSEKTISKIDWEKLKTLSAEEGQKVGSNAFFSKQLSEQHAEAIKINKELTTIKLEEEKKVIQGKIELAKQLDKQSYEPTKESQDLQKYLQEVQKKADEEFKIRELAHTQAIAEDKKREEVRLKSLNTIIKNANEKNTLTIQEEKAKQAKIEDMFIQQQNQIIKTSHKEYEEQQKKVTKVVEEELKKQAKFKDELEKAHSKALNIDESKNVKTDEQRKINIEKARQNIINSQNKELVKSEELAKKYLLLAEKGVVIGREHWASLKTIQAEELQILSIQKEKQAEIDKQSKLQEQQANLEKKRLKEINDLRYKLDKSSLGKDDRTAVSKDLYILEKRLKKENFDETLDQVKKEFQNKVEFQKAYAKELEKDAKKAEVLRIAEERRIQQGKIDLAQKLDKQSYEPSKESQDLKSYMQELQKQAEIDAKVKESINKKHTQAIIEDKKREVNEKKNLEQQEKSNRSQLEQIKLNLIKTRLMETNQLEYKRLRDQKTINKTELDDFKKKVNLQMAEQQAQRAKFTEDLSNLMVMRQFGNYMKRQTAEFEKFEDSLFQTGVVAGRSAIEIRAMRSEILEMGLDIPRTTQEILENITAVQRTGRSYEEAAQIINKSAKLAVSSGEGIALSTDVLNKALIAFNINVSETSKVMNIFHTASIKSPLDLKKISDGLKNSASSMRNFIESTDKSGQELEDYKMKLLGMNTALLAGQSALGRQASSSGMSIRTLGTKLTVLEKSAKSMLDTQLQLNNVMVKGDKIIRDGSGGIQLTSTYITDLAQRDLPRAIEMLSELYKSGEVSTQVLSKMLTGKMFAIHSGNTMSKVA